MVTLIRLIEECQPTDIRVASALLSAPGAPKKTGVLRRPFQAFLPTSEPV